jgi:hypothetical protein
VKRGTLGLVFILGLVAALVAAEAQPAGKVPVVGILNSAFTGQSTAIAAFRSGLLDAGLIEGQTIALEIRSAGGKPEALAALAAFSAAGPRAMMKSTFR